MSDALDFDSNKARIREFLSRQDYWRDFDLTASGMDALIGVLAYNTQMNAYSGFALSSETSLSSAQTRSGVIANALDRGYTPRSETAAAAVVEVRAQVTSEPTGMGLRKGAVFTATAGDREPVEFTTTSPVSGTYDPATGEVVFTDVRIREGSYEVVGATYDPARPTVQIPADKVDTTLTELYVQEGDDPDVVTRWSRSVSLTSHTPEDRVFWVYEDPVRGYVLRLGDGATSGATPPPGSALTVVYFRTSGEAGDGPDRFSVRSTDVEVDAEVRSVRTVTVKRAAGGADREDVESVRSRALRSVGSRGRAVHDGGVLTAVTRDFPEFVDAEVYGGETVGEPGRILVYLASASGRAATRDRREAVREKLEREETVGGIEVVVRDPSYVRVAPSVRVRVSRSGDDVFEAVSGAVASFSQSVLGSFSATFYGSRLTDAVDGSHPAVLSSSVTLEVGASLPLRAGSDGEVTVDLGGPVVPGSISSGRFTVGATSVSLRDRSGKVETYSSDGTVRTVGDVDYSTGMLVVGGFFPSDTVDVGVRATHSGQDVTPGAGVVAVYDARRTKVLQEVA